MAYIKDHLKLYEQYNQYYASKEPKGKMLVDKGLMTYKYKKDLGTTNDDVHKLFDDAFQNDRKNFKNAQALYIYFTFTVNQFKAKKIETQALFDKYDDVNDKIETEVSYWESQLNKVSAKEQAGTTLGRRDASVKRAAESNLKAYGTITESIDGIISEIATCEVLIPLYQKDFDANKNDAQWLQRAMNKMGQKDCTDDPMFEKLVEQKNTVEPDAGTAYYLGVLNEKKGNRAEADKFYAQSLELETEPLKKAKLINRLAEKNRKKGAYGKARQYYREALKLNPSNGTPYLRIASMYASSAKNCGDSPFNQRAVFWLAASEARKAGRADARLKKTAAQNAESYSAKAPSKSDIFSADMGGKTIKVGCWIGGSVTVPKS